MFRKATAMSAGLHVAVLVWAAISFSGKMFEVTPTEALPVDIINDKEFSEITKGVKDAPKAEQPKPLVEKKADEPKKIEEAAPKIDEKKELKAEREVKSEPPPAPPKPDPIAEKLKQEPPKQAEAQQPLPPKKPPIPQKQQPKFDANQIAAVVGAVKVAVWGVDDPVGTMSQHSH